MAVGFIMDAYYLNDGSELIINYGANRETMWRAVQYHSDCSVTMIVE